MLNINRVNPRFVHVLIVLDEANAHQSIHNSSEFLSAAPIITCKLELKADESSELDRVIPRISTVSADRIES